MSAAANRITDDALSLPAEARAQLVERLLASLNPPIDADVDRAWADEAERRIDRLESGETKLVEGDAVFKRIRDKHQQ